MHATFSAALASQELHLCHTCSSKAVVDPFTIDTNLFRHVANEYFRRYSSQQVLLHTKVQKHF